jgi:protocatechuate 3,4-dioxygenase beta subunit
MKDNEQPSAHLSRRQAIVLFGVTGASWVTGVRLISFASPSHPLCVVRPEQTEGPYFVDERLHRSDIRSDPTNGGIAPGTPLILTFQVMRLSAGDCQPMTNAQIDIWQCDANGIYSDVQDPGFNTIGRKFLRGYQLTDTQGIARFLTIYPGWYPLRTVHIHFKIRTAQLEGRRFEFTSQVYFPDELTDRIHAATPYASQGVRRVKNRQDFIFRHGGERLMLEPLETSVGYTATFPVGLVIPEV